MQETDWVCDRGAASTRAHPDPDPPRALWRPNLTSQPGNFPGAQLVSPCRGPWVSASSPTPFFSSHSGRPSPARICSARRSPAHRARRGPGAAGAAEAAEAARAAARAACELGAPASALRAGAAAASVLPPCSSSGTRCRGGQQRGRKRRKEGEKEGGCQGGLLRGRAGARFSRGGVTGTRTHSSPNLSS